MVLSVVENQNEIKKTVVCPKCKSPVYSRARRSMLVKTFLFWLPVKRYNCYKCKSKPYILQR